jgi:hypothetical protein
MLDKVMFWPLTAEWRKSWLIPSALTIGITYNARQ